jgi:hypothetical protein
MDYYDGYELAGGMVQDATVARSSLKKTGAFVESD